MVRRILKKAKDILIADPKLLYEEEKHFLHQPVYFEGTNGKAVLLIHGWTSVPYEVRRLARYLNENGYTVHAPMLRGHGTIPKDLEGVKWGDWLSDVEKEYLKLKESHGKVYVGGTSIGSNLSVLLAEKYPEIAGLVLMAMPYKFKLEKIAFFYAKFMRMIKKYNKKFYPPTFGISTTITRLVAYQTYPFDSSIEAYQLVMKSRKCIPLVKQPCILIQSSHDHMVVKNNMETIHNAIGSKVKIKKYIHKAYHTFISDIRNEHVFRDILNFLEEN